MNVDAFLAALPGAIPGFPDKPRPSGRFADILARVEGMTSPAVGALLNLACRHLEPGERYLEVGVFNGASLACALAGNEATAYAIDDFSEFGGSSDRLHASLEDEEVLERIRVIDAAAPAALAFVDEPVGVLFYDAAHDRTETLACLVAAVDHLADRALIVVDDFSWPDVRLAVVDFMRQFPIDARLVLDLPSPANMARDSWWNGVGAIDWRPYHTKPTP